VVIEDLVSGQQEENHLTILFLMISNRGPVASAATKWSATVKYKEILFNVRLIHIEDIDLSFPDKEVSLNADNAIYNVAANPIPPGGMVRGHLLFTIPHGMINERPMGAFITVRFSDIWEKQYQATYTIGDRKENLTYVPGMRLREQSSRQFNAKSN
jgi:hypothetical protein